MTTAQTVVPQNGTIWHQPKTAKLGSVEDAAAKDSKFHQSENFE